MITITNNDPLALQAIQGAIARIERGWIQDNWYHDGAYCLHGAIGSALGADVERGDVDISNSAFKHWQELSRWFSANLGRGVIGWNDSGQRTKQEVLDFLRAREADLIAAIECAKPSEQLISAIAGPVEIPEVQRELVPA